MSVRASALQLPAGTTKILPKGDLVLAKVAKVEEKTAGGIVLPISAQKRPTSGDVVALGDGHVGSHKHDFDVKVGDTILFSKFGLGATEVELCGAPHILLRERDIIGLAPHSNAEAADIPDVRPAGDRVLIKVQETADVTIGGILLPDSAKERPLSGTVVLTGPGKADRNGVRKPPELQPGDRVVYFKYAGEQMETPTGDKYVVLHDKDILAKL